MPVLIAGRELVEKGRKGVCERGIDGGEIGGATKLRQARHRKFGDAAWHDAAEMRHVGRDVERKAVERHPAPDADADRADLGLTPVAVIGPDADPTLGAARFDAELLAACREAGVEFAWVTLHVGAGTFQPVRVDDVAEHRMHAEYVEVSEETCAAVRACKERGGRVVAIGTTSVRSLETASQGGTLAPYRGDTRIFIHPGYRFRTVDALLTNFHLPESTLLMLVCAFGGFEPVMAAYRHAVAARYRFFSYGDAMFLEKSGP